jgi:hypothetical protein
VLDVTGFTLGEARRELSDAGIAVEAVKVAAPPRHKDITYDDSFRVLRVRMLCHGKAELLVCRENTD